LTATSWLLPGAALMFLASSGWVLGHSSKPAPQPVSDGTDQLGLRQDLADSSAAVADLKAQVADLRARLGRLPASAVVGGAKSGASSAGVGAGAAVGNRPGAVRPVAKPARPRPAAHAVTAGS
jgi:hypothetical protein